MLDFAKVRSEFDALLLEARLINKNQPKYNVIWRDDKHPLYIKITPGNYPKITTCRKESEKGAVYYGPFMSGKIVKDTLRFLREVVPFCTDKRIKKKPCFYAHIGLCNPCPNEIDLLDQSDKTKKTSKYVKNIRVLKRILNGKSSQVIRDLTRQMEKHSAKEEYRQAQVVKKRLEKLQYLSQPRISVKEYLTNPNLYSDVRQEELTQLASLLHIKAIERIEGYDISNIMGTNATGSMVVFVRGEPDTSSYRKFKIRFKKTPDDYAMLQEVLVRRLKHTDWPRPELFLIDGGIGQVSAVLEVFKSKNVSANVIGLAKRLEEIIIPVTKDNTIQFKKLRLKIGSPELRLVQRVRDEAHRFAKSYHLKLREKEMVY